MKNTIIFSLILSLFALSCLKYVQKQIVYTSVDTSILEHYDFNVGSCWIYRDSTSGVADSFVVTEHGKDTLIQQYGYSPDVLEYQSEVYMRIRQFHNNVTYDTIQWYISLRSNFIGYGFSTKRTDAFVFLSKPDIKDVMIQGTLYTGVKTATTEERYTYFKDDVGPLKFNLNHNIMEILRYRRL